MFYNRLFDFLNIENILYDKQFGFRKLHSTQMALILLIDKVSNALESGDFVLGVFLDFSKAFDTVNHDILLDKLYHYGIRGLAHDWLKSYLHDRRQYICYGNSSSSIKSVSCGVPQGSILEPLLFLIYINDLPLISESLYMCLFADDTNVFLTGNNLKDLENAMNDELSKLSGWLQSNKLSLNVKKTHYMIFTPPRNKINHTVDIKIDNSLIEKVDHTKFLGVIVDSKLSWKQHVVYIKGKIHKSIGIINRARHFLNGESLLTLYYAFLYPYLMYCVNIWGGACATTLSQLVRAQKRALRCVFNLPRCSHTGPIFKKHNILPLSDIYRLQILLFVYKFKMSILPSVFTNFFTKTHDIHSYSTRQVDNFYPPRFKYDTTKSTVKYIGCVFWNSLDFKTKSMNASVKCFKTHILKECIM